MLDIEKLKEVTGLSQKEIAKKLNVSEGFISQAKKQTALWMPFVELYNKHFSKKLPLSKFIKNERN